MRIFSCSHGSLFKTKVGWSMSERADKELVIKALDDAWHRRGKPHEVLFHSDQGSHYMSLKFRKHLWRKCNKV